MMHVEMIIEIYLNAIASSLVADASSSKRLAAGIKALAV